VDDRCLAGIKIYIAPYYVPNGFYSEDGNYFLDSLASGLLTAPAGAAGGGNGVYAYGSSGGFPSYIYGAASHTISSSIDVKFCLKPNGPGELSAEFYPTAT